jgi:hypothetical protein
MTRALLDPSVTHSGAIAQFAAIAPFFNGCVLGRLGLAQLKGPFSVLDKQLHMGAALA